VGAETMNGSKKGLKDAIGLMRVRLPASNVVRKGNFCFYLHFFWGWLCGVKMDFCKILLTYQQLWGI